MRVGAEVSNRMADKRTDTEPNTAGQALEEGRVVDNSIEDTAEVVPAAHMRSHMSLQRGRRGKDR